MIRNPLTMFVMEAATAMVPRIVANVVVLLTGNDDRADDRDGRNRIGQRHQRRVQQPRDVLDDLEADERRQDEHERHRPQVEIREAVADRPSSQRRL